MKKAIVAIMAHADDIELSAGATFANSIAAGARLFGAELSYGDLLENCYTTTAGTRIAPSFRGPENAEGGPSDGPLPAEELPEGSLFLTATGAGATWGGHPVVRALADTLVRWEPELVIGQPIGNMNPDHFLAAQIVAMAWHLASVRADIGPYWIPVSPTLPNEQAFPPLVPDRFADVAG